MDEETKKILEEILSDEEDSVDYNQ